jgi:hypothetical protein
MAFELVAAVKTEVDGHEAAAPLKQADIDSSVSG